MKPEVILAISATIKDLSHTEGPHFTESDVIDAMTLAKTNPDTTPEQTLRVRAFFSIVVMEFYRCTDMELHFEKLALMRKPEADDSAKTQSFNRSN